MVVNYEEGTITVVEPMEGSPAEEVGLKEGDLITKVEGEEVTPDNVNEMSDKIKGEEGTKVKLEILRGEETLNFEIEQQEYKRLNSFRCEEFNKLKVNWLDNGGIPIYK